MPTPALESPATPASDRRALALVLFVGLTLFGLRLASPSDLPDNDQERPASYVLDVVRNGHWIVQRDAVGEIASKPPLYTWLAALATLAAGGGISRGTLYLPCGLAVLGTALLIWGGARTRFGTWAATLGGLSFYLCQYGFKHVVLARSDAVFAFFVTAAALAGYRAWSVGRGWGWFWVLAAVATLTKGPLGLALAGGGLFAAGWEWRTGRPAGVRGVHWAGPLLWLAVAGGWFALAYAAVGDELIHKQIGRELIGHVTGSEAGGLKPFSQPFHAGLYFLSRYLPWSVFACLGLWRVWRHPAASDGERRFERFLFCWFAVGLVLFSIAPQKRADLLLPLIPAGAMLAGRELAGRLARVPPRRQWRAAIAGSLAILSAMFGYAHWEGTRNASMAEARAMEAMAEWWRAHAPAKLPLTFAAPLMTLQFHLNQHQFSAGPAVAAALLQGDDACFVAVSDLTDLRRHLPAGFVIHELGCEPAAGPPLVRVVSNRPSLVTPPTVAVGIGPLAVRLDELELVGARWNELILRPRELAASAAVENTAPQPVWVGYRLTTGQGECRQLAPGASWAFARQGGPLNAVSLLRARRE